MLISSSLSELAYVFPSQHSPEQKKNEVFALWKKIIVDGEGFVDRQAEKVNSSLKAYLQNKSASHGNIIRFCDQFWTEILEPVTNNENLNEEPIQRMFLMLQELAKGHIENNKWGVHELFGKISEHGLSWRHLFEDADTLVTHLKQFFIPNLLLNLPVAVSRYRTTRQCEVAVRKIAARWKTKFSNESRQTKLIDEKINSFANEAVASVCTSYKVDDVAKKDPLKNISEIKSLQTHRIASTIVRVIWVAFNFYLSFQLGFFLLPLVGEFFAMLGAPLFVLASMVISIAMTELFTLHSFIKGTAEQVFVSSFGVLLKVFAMKSAIFGLNIDIGIYLNSFGKIFEYSLNAEAIIVYMAIFGVLFVLSKLEYFKGVVPLFLMILSNKCSAELEESFFNNNFQPGNEGLAPLLDPFSVGIDKVLDFTLSYIDGVI